MNLVFDADHTLLEFDEDERLAFQAVFAAFGQPISYAQAEEYRSLSYDIWQEMGLYNVHLPEVQSAYHTLYRDYISLLWERIGVLPRAKAVEHFYRALCNGRSEVKDALFVVAELSKRHTVSIATNGLSEMQRGRLTPFLPYAKNLYISEEVGIIKPNIGFFKKLREELGEFTMIGDSLSSDIAGAAALGQRTVWFNRRDWPCATKVHADREIHSLTELLELF